MPKLKPLDAARQFGLIKAVANTGPKALTVTIEVAAVEAKRRDSFAREASEITGCDAGVYD